MATEKKTPLWDLPAIPVELMDLFVKGPIATEVVKDLFFGDGCGHEWGYSLADPRESGMAPHCIEDPDQDVFPIAAMFPLRSFLLLFFLFLHFFSIVMRLDGEEPARAQYEELERT
ncbi:TPA: hypothetical protein ACGB9W_001054 [Pseudomonas aeruginosa]